MSKDASTEHAESEKQLEQVRNLLLGKDNSRVTASFEKDARRIVADVITEALHDRQQRDNSVDKVIQPFVEDSVKHSVEHNSEQMVSSLYPIVGSLVRKSVAAFLSDFMEKTNQLLENSLTIKGLKWRIKARQSGVSYAQYAASQTFVYRVEHVFLIHRETGLLLNTVALDNENKSDADIVSAMLTAINDFVGDSFLNDDGPKEQLQAVSTDNFNLLIKPGPCALVVAAVTGNPPQKISDQLQLTVENIHSLYLDELNAFDGNNQRFEQTENLLQDCLLSEQKSKPTDKKKIPWFAIALLFIIILFIGYKITNWIKTEKLHTKIMQLDAVPGVIVKQLNIRQFDDITLDVLRDPDAASINQWLSSHDLNEQHFTIIERNYYALDPSILRQRAQRIIAAYPDLSVKWQDSNLILSGLLDITKKEQLHNALAIAGFTAGQNLITDKLQLTSALPMLESREINQQVFDDIIGRIGAIQLNFPVANEVINAEMHASLQRLYQYITQLEPIATALDINFGLLILGSSDNTGNKTTNDIISLQRAKNAADILLRKGINKDKVFVVGLGQIEIPGISSTARTVMFNIIHINQSSITNDIKQ